MPACDALRRSPLLPESALRRRSNRRKSGHNPHGPDSSRSKQDRRPRKARDLFGRRREKSSTIRATANSDVFLAWYRSQNFLSWSLAHRRLLFFRSRFESHSTAMRSVKEIPCHFSSTSQIVRRESPIGGSRNSVPLL